MATRPTDVDGFTEPCDDCGRETSHDVRLEIREESADPDGAPFSREPYRVATCMRCGVETTTRMNNA